MKNFKLLELNISIAAGFLNTQILKVIEENTNVYVVAKNIKKSLMKN